MMLEIILFLVVAFPIAWFVSEFFDHRRLRIGLGVSAIAMSFGVAWIVGSLDRLQSNIYFSEATKDLIQNTIVELERGKSDEVLSGLLELRSDFRPTYETRDEYDVLVDKYVRSLTDEPIQHETGDPLWSHETRWPSDETTIESEEEIADSESGDPATGANPEHVRPPSDIP